MSTFTQILYHLVFSTKNRERTLTQDNRHKLFQYTWGIVKKQKCHPYWINGVEDHIHIATHVHPTVALSDLIKDIKLSTTSFIKSDFIFKSFHGWQDGYAAFTYSYKDKGRLIDYIKNQEAHHKAVSFKEELIELLKEHGVQYDEKYLL